MQHQNSGSKGRGASERSSSGSFSHKHALPGVSSVLPNKLNDHMQYERAQQQQQQQQAPPGAYGNAPDALPGQLLNRTAGSESLPAMSTSNNSCVDAFGFDGGNSGMAPFSSPSSVTSSSSASSPHSSSDAQSRRDRAFLRDPHHPTHHYAVRASAASTASPSKNSNAGSSNSSSPNAMNVSGARNSTGGEGAEVDTVGSAQQGSYDDTITDSDSMAMMDDGTVPRSTPMPTRSIRQQAAINAASQVAAAVAAGAPGPLRHAPSSHSIESTRGANGDDAGAVVRPPVYQGAVPSAAVTKANLAEQHRAAAAAAAAVAAAATNPSSPITQSPTSSTGGSSRQRRHSTSSTPLRTRRLARKSSPHPQPAPSTSLTKRSPLFRFLSTSYGSAVMLNRLQSGGIFLKHDARGSPHYRIVACTTDMRHLYWADLRTRKIHGSLPVDTLLKISKGFNSRMLIQKKDKQDALASAAATTTTTTDATDVQLQSHLPRQAQRNSLFSSSSAQQPQQPQHAPQTHLDGDRLLSICATIRTLDLECVSLEERDDWSKTFEFLIEYNRQQRTNELQGRKQNVQQAENTIAAPSAAIAAAAATSSNSVAATRGPSASTSVSGSATHSRRVSIVSALELLCDQNVEAIEKHQRSKAAQQSKADAAAAAAAAAAPTPNKRSLLATLTGSGSSSNRAASTPTAAAGNVGAPDKLSAAVSSQHATAVTWPVSDGSVVVRLSPGETEKMRLRLEHEVDQAVAKNRSTLIGMCSKQIDMQRTIDELTRQNMQLIMLMCPKEVTW